METVWRDTYVLQAQYLQILLRTVEIGRIAPAVATHCAHGDFSVPQAHRLLYPVHMDIFFLMRAAPISRAANFALLDLNAKLVPFWRLNVLLASTVHMALSQNCVALVVTKKCPVNQVHRAPIALLVIGARNPAFIL